MTNIARIKEDERDITFKRQIWRKFFTLTDPIDPESFLIMLKDAGLKVKRPHVYHTLTLLTDYGFADRDRRDDLELTFYRCR